MLNEIKSRFLSGKRILVILAMLFAMSANAQWVQTSFYGGQNAAVFALAKIGSNIFTGVDQYGVQISTNNGLNWSQTALNNKFVFCLFVDPITNYIYAGSQSYYYYSQDIGTYWYTVMMLAGNVYSITANTHYQFFGTSSGGVLRNGTYTPLNYLCINSVIAIGDSIFAGAQNTGIYFSSNNGTDWTQTSINNKTINTLAVSGNNIYAGSVSNGVYRSTNKGANWAQTSLLSVTVNSIITSGSNVFAGTSNGFYFSTNNGVNWTIQNDGFNSSPQIKTLLTANNYLFAGTGGSVWRRPLSEILGVHNISTETPSKYSLSQNYPNPFNPTTNIKFSIVNSGEVKLVVYDIQGREVRTLVNESLKPGTYEAAFDGSSLNSGVYFYKLLTNGFSETKKMLMIK